MKPFSMLATHGTLWFTTEERRKGLKVGDIVEINGVKLKVRLISVDCIDLRPKGWKP